VQAFGPLSGINVINYYVRNCLVVYCSCSVHIRNRLILSSRDHASTRFWVSQLARVS
jgi:hypothetical protein